MLSINSAFVLIISGIVFHACGGGSGSGRGREAYVTIHKKSESEKEPISESTATAFNAIYKANIGKFGRLKLSDPIRNGKDQSTSYTSFWAFTRGENTRCAFVRYNMAFDSSLPQGNDFFKDLTLVKRPVTLRNIDLQKLSTPLWTHKLDDIDYIADALGLGKLNDYAYIESECCGECSHFDAYLKERIMPQYDDYFVMSPKNLVWNLRDALRSGFIKTQPIPNGISFELPQEIQSRLRKILQRDLSKLNEFEKKEIKSKLIIDNNTRQFFALRNNDESCPIIEFSVIPSVTITRGSKQYEWLGEKSHFLFTENPQWDSNSWTLATESQFEMKWTYSECDEGRGIFVWPVHEVNN